jgi:nucleoside-diphosphate-sugar epimerase
MKVFVTGSAGFVGSTLSLHLLERGDEVVGINNHNDYSGPALNKRVWRDRLITPITHTAASILLIVPAWRRYSMSISRKVQLT